MNKRGKFFLALLILMTVAVFAACSGKKTDETSQDELSSDSATSGESYVWENVTDEKQLVVMTVCDEGIVPELYAMEMNSNTYLTFTDLDSEWHIAQITNGVWGIVAISGENTAEALIKVTDDDSLYIVYLDLVSEDEEAEEDSSEDTDESDESQ